MHSQFFSRTKSSSEISLVSSKSLRKPSTLLNIIRKHFAAIKIWYEASQMKIFSYGFLSNKTLTK